MNTVATPLGVEISSFDDEDSMLGPVDIDNGSPTDVGGDDAASYPDDESNVKTNHNDKSDVDQLDDDEYDKTNPKELDANHAVTAVGWFRQWWVIVWYKNCPLLQRRPIHLLILVFSGVAAVLVAWPAGRDYAADQAIFPPTLTDCGTVPPNFLSSLPNATDVSKVKLSMNDNWQSGLPVAVLSLGPMLTAIATYLIVHEEIQLHMLGVLRGLGMRDSVYWFSWYIPFAAIAVVNSLFAAITAKLVPVHVFGATYFGGIFGAFFFVQLALIGSSFFLAALSGVARRGAVWLILLMIVAVWVPINVLASQRSYNVSVATLANGSADLHTPIGLFWVNRQTMYPVVSINLGGTGTANTNNATCNIPIMSEQEGNYFKTTAERAQVLPTEFFLGCYASAGFGATAWAPIKKTDFGLAVFWFIPYFHFNTIWGNFAGFTGYPGIDFHASHARLTTGELAREVLPVPPSSANAQGTSLYPQGSMLQEQQSTKTECETKDSSGTGCIKYKSNCPAQNLQGYNFCAAVETHDCFYAPNSPAEGKSVLAMFGMLLALSLTYVLMASYWGIVFVGGAGTHRFYFFLLPSYWFGVRRRINNNDRSVDDDDEAGDYEAQQRRSSTSPDAGAVKVHAVSKFYGGVQALKPVTFEMARGEVTALLGHNGAGKTTLSKVLTCEVAATAGDITVFGHSVRDDPYAVRRIVGVCKQDDYLYPNLTAKEHLDLFGGLRGVDPKEHDDIVQKWLESVDLDSVQHQYSSQFSGGMKRRLSLAMSTIGSRLLIVLDEPTTGMDPVSRRFVWKHIDEIKKNRVVLLTTHAMEEADLLADMVAIMRKGELAAWGSPLQLKTEHGSALQFSVLVDKEKVQETSTRIGAQFASAMKWVKLDVGEAGNITVKIIKIKQNDQDQGVSFEALTIFVAWLEDPISGVLEYGFSNSSLEEVFLQVTEGDVEEISESQVSLDDELAAMSADSGRNLTDFKPRLTVRGQVMALVWHNLIRTWTGKRSLGSWAIYGLFLGASTVLAIQLANASDKIPTLATQVAVLSFILLSICSTTYGDRAEGLFYLMRTQGLLKTSYLTGTGVYAFLISFVYSIVVLSALFATHFFRAATICTPNVQNQFCSTTKFGDSPTILYSDLQEVTNFDPGSFNGTAVRIFAYAAPSGYWLVFGAGAVFALTVPGAALASGYLPGHKFALVLIAFISLMASITPLIIYFIRLFVNSDEKFLDCYNSVVPQSTCANTTFTTDTANEDFLNCVGLQINYYNPQSLCAPGYTGLLPQFGLFQMLSLALIANIKFVSEPAEYAEQILIPSIKGENCSGDSCSFPYVLKLYLEFLGWEIFGAIILIIVGVAIAHIFAFPTAGVLYAKNIIVHAIESMRCQRGKSKQPHQSSKEKEEFEEVAQERETVQEIIQPYLKKPAPDAADEGSDDEGPVIADHSTLPRNDLPPILMHKLCKVYPSFGRTPAKVALKSLDLHVPKGQILGFLGKNGAGKTTALKILAGAHDATSGVGLVSGYDVSCERINVFESLGNCPQFDVIWPKLTVAEHLLFFAKLKGLPRKKVHAACQSIAAAVGLGSKEVYKRNAGALSGGMRRRLSIAIALIGAPSVFVLDEPTTGLDPSTRNNIWGLINSFATDERAIVITTHMMLEADTLCNRIAIVAKGELVVVATQQRLKDKFGSGYLLQLNLVKSNPENQELAMDFARNELHKDAMLGTKQAKTLHVNLPRNLNLKRAFSALYNPAIRPSCINQFLLSQSSLEDVFITLGE